MQHITPTQKSSLSAGDVVGRRYVIQGRIGAGSMGEIYLALQRPFDRPTAIKVLQPWSMQDEEIRRRFFLEGRVLSRLTHPNTVTVFEFGRHRDVFFIAMEYVRGQSLGELIGSRGPLPPEDAIPLAIQVAQSLGEAHSLGVVHRDLKPENILVSGRSSGAPFVKVVDFGIAKLARVEARSSAAMVGTPHFMAPEQIQGDIIDGRTDLYALGCCLYEMLTGAPPFDGPTAMSVLMSHANDPRPELPEHLPRALSRFVRRAMAIDPDDRPADAATFTAELIAAATAHHVNPSPPQPPPLRRTPSSLEVEALRSSGLPAAEPETEAEEHDPIWIDVAPMETHPGHLATADHTDPGPPPPKAAQTPAIAETPAIAAVMATPSAASSRRSQLLVGLAVAAVSLALLLLLLPESHTVVFESTPDGAVVEIDGVPVGTTPLTLEVDEARVEGRIIKPGFEPMPFAQVSSEGRVFGALEPALIALSISVPEDVRGAVLVVNGEDLGVVGAKRVVRLAWPQGEGLRLELRSDRHETIVESIPNAALRPQLELDIDPGRLVKR